MDIETIKTQADRVLRVLRRAGEPLTSQTIEARSRLSLRVVRRALRWCILDGRVLKGTRWTGQHSYTWVYWPAKWNK